jgi:hypothetical protein
MDNIKRLTIPECDRAGLVIVEYPVLEEPVIAEVALKQGKD